VPLMLLTSLTVSVFLSDMIFLSLALS